MQSENKPKYMGTKDAAERWKVEQNTVSMWCRKGKIEGVEQDAPQSPWRIPIDAKRP